MTTLILHPAGRETARWTIPDTDGTEGLAVSFDDGYTWKPLTFDDGDWTLLVQGDRAGGDPGTALTMTSGLYGALIRAEGGGSIVLREAGAIYVQADCTPWPVDWSACGGPPSDPDIRERAEHLAVSTLRNLTLNRVGGCPITVRPCSQGCESPTVGYWAGTATTFFPHVNARGRWVNSCGCSGRCHCGPAMAELVLDGPVGRVDEVFVQGVILDESLYRLDGDTLVRLDGEPWPACQDMTQNNHGPDAFSVTYLRGYPVSFMGAIAAGVLANEFAKACSGKSCALPAGVTQISRQGSTLTISADMFGEGLTGIREVDAFTAQWNPNRLRVRPMVYSPDVVEHRRVGR